MALAALLGMVVGSGSVSCSQRSETADSDVTFVRSARARILEATSIERIQILHRQELLIDQEQAGSGICGYRQTGEVVAVLDGTRLDGDFISNEPLDPGGEYVVALRRISTDAPESEDPLLEERDRRFLSCRQRVPLYALGAAAIIEIDGVQRVDVEASNLVPLKFRDKATEGTIRLDTLLDYIRRIRRESTQSGAG